MVVASEQPKCPTGVLAERKRVGFSAGVEEGDLEGVLGDGTMLADELVEPRLHV